MTTKMIEIGEAKDFPKMMEWFKAHPIENYVRVGRDGKEYIDHSGYVAELKRELRYD